ncbi:MAG: hypothetical protein V4511_03005 [Bacteroidota bacterium]
MQNNTPQPTINDFSDTVKLEFSEAIAKPKHTAKFIGKKLSEFMSEGRDLMSLNSYSKALTAFEKACIVDPNDANAKAERAEAAGWVNAVSRAKSASIKNITVNNTTNGTRMKSYSEKQNKDKSTL